MAGKASTKPGEWVRGSLIGSGAFGVVNLAMNKCTGGLFVVKSAPSSGAGFQSLKNEFDILQSLDSPLVVRCMGHECSDSPGGEQRFHLFMEYMAGGSLSEILQRFGGTLDEPVIRTYTKEILRGIQYMHTKGIVHGDLKCKNVLLSSAGDVKLADFGSARRLQSSPAASGPDGPCRHPVICGTPLWMAPEALRNERTGLASDIWSLGCTVIEMATGRPPWGDELPNSMAGAVFKIACSDDTPRLPPNLSEEGIDFLRRCLQRDASLRWNAEELLKHPFVAGEWEGRSPCKRPGGGSPTSILGEGQWCLVEEDSPISAEAAAVERRPFSRRCSEGEERRKQYNCNEIGADRAAWVSVRSD